ncbi:uncharacterized protein LOC133628879 [Colius striatus]|uniref:uncharacterized protein LOC133628879 n=1 Tax=Colius striatus TaxID=57412 RepID=UPI002B1D0250|nr:uncharacterized protein LOC133628879 [Colius striatus]
MSREEKFNGFVLPAILNVLFELAPTKCNDSLRKSICFGFNVGRSRPWHRRKERLRYLRRWRLRKLSGGKSGERGQRREFIVIGRLGRAWRQRIWEKTENVERTWNAERAESDGSTAQEDHRRVGKRDPMLDWVPLGTRGETENAAESDTDCAAGAGSGAESSAERSAGSSAENSTERSAASSAGNCAEAGDTDKRVKSAAPRSAKDGA